MAATVVIILLCLSIILHTPPNPYAVGFVNHPHT
jgi:hypothetical protein